MIQRFGETIQRFTRNKTAVAIASIIAGIYLMIARRDATTVLIRVIGFALLGVAAVYLVLYFVGKNRDQVQLVYAGGAAVLGLLTRWLAPAILNIFPILLGAAIIVAGISNLTAARDPVYPRTSVIGPILTIVLGAVVVFHPGAVMSWIIFLGGAALVLNGLTELDLIRRIWKQ